MEKIGVICWIFLLWLALYYTNTGVLTVYLPTGTLLMKQPRWPKLNISILYCVIIFLSLLDKEIGYYSNLQMMQLKDKFRISSCHYFVQKSHRQTDRALIRLMWGLKNNLLTLKSHYASMSSFVYVSACVLCTLYGQNYMHLWPSHSYFLVK